MQRVGSFPGVSSVRAAWLGDVRTDLLSGLVVAIALIPEAISFSIIAGVDPKVGLYASFTIAIVISLVGGRAGMISAATGAVALLVVPLVRDHGVQYLFAAGLLAGGFQILFGVLKVGQLMRFVPRPVMVGFVNALAILIFLAQVPHVRGGSWVVYAVAAAGLALIYLVPRVTSAVPAPLVAIVVLTTAAVLLHVHVPTVKDMGALPSALPGFGLPGVPLTLHTLAIVAPYSLSIAVVGLIESLLTAKLIDDITDTPSDKDRECRGQGVANIASALVGGLPGCAMIGQSMINMQSGGRSRSRRSRPASSAPVARRLRRRRREDPRRGARGGDGRRRGQHVRLVEHQAGRPPSRAAERARRDGGDRRDRRRQRTPPAARPACCCRRSSSRAASRI